MNKSEIKSEIKKTKELNALLLSCAKDKSLPLEERNSYYKDYMKGAFYLLKLTKEEKLND